MSLEGHLDACCPVPLVQYKHQGSRCYCCSQKTAAIASTPEAPHHLRPFSFAPHDPLPQPKHFQEDILLHLCPLLLPLSQCNPCKCMPSDQRAVKQALYFTHEQSLCCFHLHPVHIQPVAPSGPTKLQGTLGSDKRSVTAPSFDVQDVEPCAPSVGQHSHSLHG
eukprot:4181041-Amphidinium_carterae.1